MSYQIDYNSHLKVLVFLFQEAMSGSSSFGPEWEEMKETLSKELRYKNLGFKKAISPMIQSYVAMYSSNDLYIRDITNFITTYGEKFW